MGAPSILVNAFLREATEGEDFQPVADVEVVYQRLRTIQRGHFTEATESSGVVQISSTIGSTAFTFAIPSKLDRSQIIEVAEAALARIDGLTTVAQIRALLKRHKSARAYFGEWVVT